MRQLRPQQYDALERAIVDGRRIVITRRGSEHTVIPLRIVASGSRELLEVRHPTTGEQMRFWLDELDRLEVVL
ncbi:MAG TPA: hypothetical protein VFZ56_01315 [Gemmatimonadaceae bacterium]